ncbi:hypothetical protein SUGI_0693390 [Cryptomeria japonica]|nr:hypothetical protein SUGI_0693390 [Cryptomeria japonica]
MRGWNNRAAALLRNPCGNATTESRTRKHVPTELAALLSTSDVFPGYPFYPLLSTDEVRSKLKNRIEEIPRPWHFLDLNRIVITDILSSPESSAAVEGDGRYGWWTMSLRVKILNCLFRKRFGNSDARSTPTAQLLDCAGIRFQPGKIRFEKGTFVKSTISLPQINVDDTTETLLRNLMAYQECQRCPFNPEETVISHYVRLLDCLIDSKEDVFVLRNSGVIRSLSGSDDQIVAMFTIFRLEPLLVPSINLRS